MTMRKKDYEAIAQVIASEHERGPSKALSMDLHNVALGIAEYCATQDPTFKHERFLADCGVQS